MAIGTLSARILMDASGVKSGMGLTRAEMRLTRQAFVDSTSDVQKLETALATLAGARDKGAFADEQQYAAAIAAVRAELDPVVALERERAALADAAQGQAMQRGQALTESLATPDERRAQRLVEVNDLLGRSAISQETYNRALRQMDSERWTELGTNVRNAGAAIAATAGVITAGLVAVGASALDEAAKYEQTQIAFTTMLGSAEAAEATLQSLTGFAAATPFQMPEIEQVARGLIMFGETGDEMMSTLKILGDAASGTGASFGEIGQIFNKVRGQGKLMTGEFNQLAERGIISMQDLADHFGVATNEIAGMLSGGNVSFDDLREVMAGLTGEGGRFADMMLQQSASLGGMQSTLADQFGILSREIGMELLPAAKGVTQWAMDATAGFSELDGGTKTLIAGSLALGTGLAGIVTAGGAAVAVAGQLTIWYGAMQASATGAKIAQLGLNTAIGVGYVAAAAAAAGAGYALGQSLYNASEAGQNADRIFRGLADSTASIQGVDFAGNSQADLEAYIASTQTQIAKFEEHNEQLRGQQAWYNFWQQNADLVDNNSQHVEVLRENIAKAKLAMAAESPAAVQSQAIDAVDKLTASLQEQIIVAGLDADTIERWKLQQEGATAGQLQAVAALQQQAAAAQATASLREDTNKLVDSLQAEIATVGKTEAEVRRLELAARGLSPEWLRVVEGMQTELAAAKQIEQVRQNVDQLTGSLQEQIATAGMSAEAIEQWKLAQQGATPAQLAAIALLREQAQAATAEAQARKDAQADALAQEQQLQQSVQQTTDTLRDEIATWGMSAEEAALARLAQQGASAEQIAEVEKLQAELGELQRQKDKLTATDSTIDVSSMGEMFDRLRERNTLPPDKPAEKPDVPQSVDRYAGIGEPVPVPSPQPPAADQPLLQIPAEVQVTWPDILASMPDAPPMPVEYDASGEPIALPPGPQPPAMAADIAGNWSPLPPAPQPADLAADIAGNWSPLPPAPQPADLAADIAANWSPLPPAPPIGELVPAHGRDRYAGIGEPEPAGPAEDKQLPWLQKIAKGIDAIAKKEGITVEEMRL